MQLAVVGAGRNEKLCTYGVCRVIQHTSSLSFLVSRGQLCVGKLNRISTVTE